MTGLVIVGHGTRSAAGVDQFAALVERVRRRGDVGDVEGGFIELSRPPLTDAVGALVARGHRALVALPLVLTAAGHGKGDIPAAMAREQERHPGLSYRYGRPLGPHPLLHEALEERIDAALAGAHPAGTGLADTVDRAGTWVALIGRGSTDPDANAEVAKVARLLWEGRGYAGVEPGFVSLASPSVPAVLERLRRLGARRIVVAPYFLFAGVLPDRIVAQSAEFAAAHPDLDVRVAEVIGDCDALADLVRERYAEALGGDIRMNCDTCAYRVLMPGFADKVGRPQRPHDHPDDPVGHHHHHGHDHGHAHDHGSVAVVGGGPGPDDLITVRGKALLDAADVVVVDRLAPQGLLAGLRPDVLVVDAAKVPRGPSMAQEAINAALVSHARAGRRVVRLKGGDPYVFGRGHEEVQACTAAGVPVTVVPGVSSAIAAPALMRRAGDAPRRGARRHSRVRTPAARAPRLARRLGGAGARPGHRRVADGRRHHRQDRVGADRARSRPGDSGARRAGRRAGRPAVGARPAGRDRRGSHPGGHSSARRLRPRPGGRAVDHRAHGLTITRCGRSPDR